MPDAAAAVDLPGSLPWPRPAAPVTLDFDLAPEDLPRLLRMPDLARDGRPAPVRLEWHGTADGLPAAQGPGAPADGAPARAPVAPAASFRGRRHRFTVGDVALEVLEGHLRGAVIRPACRVSLAGPSRAVAQQAVALAAGLHLEVARTGLSQEALAAPRHLGIPDVQPGQPLTANIALVIGQLLDSMQHWAATAGDGTEPTPVHQMRVATRRLRSALSIFKGPAACPELEAAAPALRQTAAELGGARDWDVFLGGIGAQAAKLFPDDARVAALMAAGARRRGAAYARLRVHLASPDHRSMGMALACAAALRPWEGLGAEQDAALHADTAVFAAAALDRRLKRVRRAGHGLATLPVPALHELRKDCKRLRYAAEFFQPLFPDKAGRRFVKRLAALQEALGLLNDGAAAAALLAQLGRGGEGYAAGLVAGVAAAQSAAARTGIRHAWRRFRRAEPFWS